MSQIVDSIYTTAVTLVACDKMNGLEITEGWMWGSSWDESSGGRADSEIETWKLRGRKLLMP